MNTFVGNTNSQVFCTRFSNDDKMVVTGTIDGDIKVYDVYESTQNAYFRQNSNPVQELEERYPTHDLPALEATQRQREQQQLHIDLR